jgi:small subunit ribosomal protein S15
MKNLNNNNLKEENIINQIQKHKNDVGSIEVQIIQLSFQIENIKNYLLKNKKDIQTKRKINQIVEKRRTFLKYIKEINPDKHLKIINLMKKEKL